MLLSFYDARHSESPAEEIDLSLYCILQYELFKLSNERVHDLF
jgi:hypothetical protein